MFKKERSTWNLFLAFALSLCFAFTSSSAFAENPHPLEIGTRNLADREDAEKMASELIAQSHVGDEVILYHTGDSLPNSLEYIIQRCSQAKMSLK